MSDKLNLHSGTCSEAAGLISSLAPGLVERCPAVVAALIGLSGRPVQVFREEGEVALRQIKEALRGGRGNPPFLGFIFRP